MRIITVAACMFAAGLAGCANPDRNSARVYHSSTRSPVASASRSYPTSLPRNEAKPMRRPARRASRPVRPPRPVAHVSAAWYPRGRRISSRWKAIVVHHSATESGSAATFDKHHKEKGWDELGYHFVIGNGTDTPDGRIEIGPRWQKQKHGAHCKTPSKYYNQHGIGICLVGDFTKEPPTRAQKAALVRLVRFLRAECGIALHEITTHKAVTRKTACPGRHLSLTWLRRAVSVRATASALP